YGDWSSDVCSSDLLEVTGLLQVADQVGHRISAQSHSLYINVRAGVLHGAKPDGLRAIDGVANGVQQVDRTGVNLSRPQLVDHIHAALVAVGLLLTLQVLRFHVG